MVAVARHGGKGWVMWGHGFSYTNGAMGLFGLFSTLADDIANLAHKVRESLGKYRYKDKRLK
jgi:hypothetical protein